MTLPRARIGMVAAQLGKLDERLRDPLARTLLTGNEHKLVFSEVQYHIGNDHYLLGELQVALMDDAIYQSLKSSKIKFC